MFNFFFVSLIPLIFYKGSKLVPYRSQNEQQNERDPKTQSSCFLYILNISDYHNSSKISGSRFRD